MLMGHKSMGHYQTLEQTAGTGSLQAMDGRRVHSPGALQFPKGMSPWEKCGITLPSSC